MCVHACSSVIRTHPPERAAASGGGPGDRAWDRPRQPGVSLNQRLVRSQPATQLHSAPLLPPPSGLAWGGWLVGWLVDWFVGTLIAFVGLAVLLTYLQIGQSVWLIDWLIDWLVDLLFGWLINGCLTDWFIDRSIDWLISQMVGL